MTLDCIVGIRILIMTAREVAKKLNKAGATWTQGRGSHRKYTLGKCRTSLSMHTGDIATGTLRQIEKDMEPCIGKRWLSK